MKTQLLALAAALASTPAWATLGTTDDASPEVALRPAAYSAQPARPAPTSCGTPKHMMFLLRDESGAIVAAALVQVTPDC